MQSNDQGRFFQSMSGRRRGEFGPCASSAGVCRRSDAEGMAIVVDRTAASSAKIPGQVEQPASGAAASAGQWQSALDFDDAGAALERATAFRPVALDASGTAPGSAPAMAAV